MPSFSGSSSEEQTDSRHTLTAVIESSPSVDLTALVSSKGIKKEEIKPEDTLESEEGEEISLLNRPGLGGPFDLTNTRNRDPQKYSLFPTIGSDIQDALSSYPFPIESQDLKLIHHCSYSP
jgi:hypothetical protein